MTVGVGSPYPELAALAADCFTDCTGLPVKILGAKEFELSGLPHPAAMRLVCFDFTTENSVIYFDADWFSLRSWNPFDFDDGRLQAARDFITLKEWPRQEYDFSSPQFDDTAAYSKYSDDELRIDYIREVISFIKYPTMPEFWINTGFMKLNRNAHSNLLMRALSLYLGEVGHHPKYFEQPAFNLALQNEIHLLRLLPRSFNVLAGRPARWAKKVIGLHVKIKNHSDFVGLVMSGKIKKSNHVRKYFHLENS